MTYLMTQSLTRSLALPCLALVGTVLAAGIVQAAGLPQDQDTLSVAVAPPPTDINGLDIDIPTGFKFFVADQLVYDDNVFRLPSGNYTYFYDTAGPNAHRGDYIDTGSVGLDGKYDVGRQSFLVDVRVDDNRYDHNHNLDNVGGTGKVVWDWVVGSQLGGQIGADYSRALQGFASTTVYSKDLADRSEYFGSLRFQIGPRWGVFGGVLYSDNTVSDFAVRENDFKGKSGLVGGDYAIGANSTLGIEYRYTDASYEYQLPTLNPNYSEDTLRALFQYALSGKLQMSVSAGYLKRDYEHPSGRIQGFTGDVWRAAVLWQISDKTQLVGTASRNLQAFIADGADYYVDTGESIAPVWLATDKVNVSVVISRDGDDYLSAGATPTISARRDTIVAEELDVNYLPRDYLVLKFGFRNERRQSNQQDFTYRDELATASIMYTFL